MRKTAFIGHRQVFGNEVFERILCEVENQIGLGCKSFTMGTHGEFDRLALSACRSLRKRYSDIEIEVVITSLNTIKKYGEFNTAPYDDVHTVMFDIEDAHFKQRITLSNRQMIDSCNTLICYVDERVQQSGAKAAMRYAKKKGLTIINLYREEDKPFYGMTQEEIEAYWTNL